MELRDRDGDLFTHLNDVYPVRPTMVPPNAALAAWTIEDDGEGPTHEELVKGLGKVAMVTTAKGANGTRRTLMTWRQRLGHPSFGTLVALAESGAKGMAITEPPKTVPSLDARAGCVAAKAVQFPHKGATVQSSNTSISPWTSTVVRCTRAC